MNLNSIPREFIDDPDFTTSLQTLYLGAAAGSENLYVNIDYVKPGAASTKYHAHSKQEEFFLILNGTGILRMDGEERPVRQGDFIAKPAGKGIAHQFLNTGTEILQILDCGTVAQGDVITYPDDGVIYLKDQRQAFRQSDSLQGWTSDPNTAEEK